MKNRGWIPCGLLIVLSTGCGASQEASLDATQAGPATSDPYAHGFTDADYPRVIEVAEDVYAYEQIHATGGEVITTVSLIVVTAGGRARRGRAGEPRRDAAAGRHDRGHHRPADHARHCRLGPRGPHGRKLGVPGGRALLRAPDFGGDPGGERGEPQPARGCTAGRRPDGDRGDRHGARTRRPRDPAPAPRPRPHRAGISWSICPRGRCCS